ncbi:MAG: hypothetical protein AAGA66_07455 [Bacteroidota bacterium]
MKNLLIILISSVTLFAACDSEDVSITYTKGTAIYGDLSAIRATELVAPSKSLNDAGKIFVSNDLLLIGEEGEGIHVYDNRNPEAPTPVSFLNIPGNREFFVDGSFIYAESYYDLLKIDISTSQPSIVSRLEHAIADEIRGQNGESLIGFELEEVTETFDKNDDAYSQIWDSEGFLYYDYDQRLIPPSAVPASFAGNGTDNIGSINRIASLDNHLYVISKTTLSVYDTENFSQIFSNSVGWQMETIYPMGDRIFIGTSNSVDIFNVSNPENPLPEGSFWHATSCDPVLPVSEETAYATLRTGEFAECPGDVNALVVLDISSTGDWAIHQVQEIQMESPYGLTKIGDNLYVGEGANGLKVFDASSEQNLRLLKHDQNVEAYDVIPHPNRNDLLLIAGPDGLSQYTVGPNTDLLKLSTIAF